MLKIYAAKMDETRQHECAIELLNNILFRMGLPTPAAYEWNAHGKPYLLPPNEKIYVNWSHSGDYVLCAVSDRELGVDLEQMRRTPDERLVKRVIRGEEREYYDSVSPEEQKQLFYEYWTLKESFLKAIGTGFYTPLDAFRIMRGGEYPVVCQEVDSRRWQCRLLTFAEKDYAAAVCCEEFPEQLEINYL